MKLQIKCKFIFRHNRPSKDVSSNSLLSARWAPLAIKIKINNLNILLPLFLCSSFLFSFFLTSRLFFMSISFFSVFLFLPHFHSLGKALLTRAAFHLICMLCYEVIIFARFTFDSVVVSRSAFSLSLSLQYTKRCQLEKEDEEEQTARRII